MAVRRRILFFLATNPACERAILGSSRLRARAWRSARRYVAGWTAADALAVARTLAAEGLRASIDQFGEHVRSAEEAGRVATEYRALAAGLDAAPAGTWLSLDLSHVAFDGGHLRTIARAVPDGVRLQVGAEEEATTDTVQQAVMAAVADGLPVTATLQANLRRSPDDAARLAQAGVPIRLVKGAYLEAPSIAYPYGPETDEAYLRLAEILARNGAEVFLATHDDALREQALRMLPDATCELLMGIHRDRARELARAGHTVRIYVPFGENWLRYFLRRRAESQGTA